MLARKIIKTYEESTKALNHEKEKFYIKVDSMFTIFMAVEIVKTVALIVIVKKVH